uniref:Nfu_N domain-containing protein n=1 Tax=Globodera pallida TaxID=36090 RepID=A0A183BP46_GLOPA
MFKFRSAADLFLCCCASSASIVARKFVLTPILLKCSSPQMQMNIRCISKSPNRFMFIQVQETPNPLSLKFLPGQKVLAEPGRTYEFTSALEAAKRSPLARQLLRIDGVRSVFFGEDFVSIQKQSIEEEWALLKPHIFAAIMDHLLSGKPVVQAETDATEAAEPTDTTYIIRSYTNPNRMPNDEMPPRPNDLDKMPKRSTEMRHFETEPALSSTSPAPSSLASDSFSTIRRNCERHMRRLERYKKARSFCSLDNAVDDAEADGNGNKTMVEGGATAATVAELEHEDSEQCQKQTIQRTADEERTDCDDDGGGEQFESLRAKMLSLMENDMLLLAKLLQLGDTLCELRSKQEQQQQQQPPHQQQQQQKIDRIASSSSWDDDGQQNGFFDDDEDEMDDEDDDVAVSSSSPPPPPPAPPRSLLHRARQHRRRAPLPPEFGRAAASGATVSRVYLEGEEQQQANNNAIPGGGGPSGAVAGGVVVGVDQQQAEEEDDQISPNIQYFSRKNSVLRIPIPPRASNRNFGRPKFLHQRMNSSTFSSSSSASSIMASSAKPLSAQCRAVHYHPSTTTTMTMMMTATTTPSTIVEADLDSGHSSASSEADPQQHSPPGAPSSRFSTFSSSLSTGSASSRSFASSAAPAADAKRTKSEERGGGGGGEHQRAVAEAAVEQQKTTTTRTKFC